MLQHRLSTVMNINTVNTFGKPAMFICDADKSAAAATGINHNNKAWNWFFRQSLYIPMRS